MSNKPLDLSKFKDNFSRKNITIILVVVGLLGILLIGCSELFKSPTNNKVNETASTSNSSEYIEDTEQRLENIIGLINGVGRVKVLVTVESGVENIYETDDKTTNGKQQSGGQSTQTQENLSKESSHVIIDGNSGSEQALLTKQLEPKILGVVIVCDGGNNLEVKESVIQSVSTALGLPTNRISVNIMQK